MSNVPFFYQNKDSLFKEIGTFLIRQSTGHGDGQCCCRVSLHLRLEFECCSKEPLQSDANLTVMRRKPFREMGYHGPSLWIFHCILWTCSDLLQRPASIQVEYNRRARSSPSLTPQWSLEVTWWRCDTKGILQKCETCTLKEKSKKKPLCCFCSTATCFSPLHLCEVDSQLDPSAAFWSALWFMVWGYSLNHDCVNARLFYRHPVEQMTNVHLKQTCIYIHHQGLTLTPANLCVCISAMACNTVTPTSHFLYNICHFLYNIYIFQL